MRKITGGEVEVPLAAGMTAADLKQELQRRDEGPVAQLRLLYAGKELVDGLTLQLQKVRPGVTIHLVLKHVPIKLLPPSQGSSSLSLGAYGGGKRGKFAGLRNQGATCYLNSLLQAMYMTPDFKHALQQCTASELPALPRALCQLFSELQVS